MHGAGAANDRALVDRSIRDRAVPRTSQLNVGIGTEDTH